MCGAMGLRTLVARGRAPARYPQPVRCADQDRHLHARRGIRPQSDRAYAACAAHSYRGGVMTKICKVTFNNQPFLVNCGDLLLDSALMSGVELQHDCRSGICGSCKVRLVDGKVFGDIDDNSDLIYACQARIVSDLKVVVELTPDPVSMPASVAELVELAPDVVGLSLQFQ